MYNNRQSKRTAYVYVGAVPEVFLHLYRGEQTTELTA